MNLLAAAALALSTATPSPQAAAAQEASHALPNVLVLMADDLGYGDLSTYGGWISTPRLDELARQGARFTQAYSAAPICTPSSAGFFTGQYPARLGIQGDAGPNKVARKHNRGMASEVVTLPERMKELGYHTGLVGKWQLGPQDEMRPSRQGFDEFFGFLGPSHAYMPDAQDAKMLRGDEPEKELEHEYLTDALARESESFLARNKASPFFLCVAFNAAHSPYQATDNYVQRFPGLAKKEQIYSAMVSALDDAVGRVLAALEKEGLASSTLVFFVSSNGAMLEESPGRNAPCSMGKGFLFEGGIRVPMLLRWPGHVTAGATVASPVSLLDIAATSLKLAGAKSEALAELDGQDLMPVLAGAAPERTLLWKVGYSGAIRHGDWKLVTSRTSRWLFHVSEDAAEEVDLLAEKPENAAALTAEFQSWAATLPPQGWKNSEVPSPYQVLAKPYWVEY